MSNTFKAKKKKKLTKEQLNQKVLYFAYGSNMHQPRLEERVGEVRFVSAYSLPNYKLTFDTGMGNCSFANVKECDRETCEGIIFEMTYKQLLILDGFEGLYDRVKVMYGDRRLHFYVSDYFRDERKIPQLTTEYYALLMLGCTEHNLKKSLSIVQTLKPVPHMIYTSKEVYYQVEGEW